jgi:flagellar biosynthesis protein FlhA
MSESVAQQGIAGRMNLRQMLAPLLIVLILSMMVLPLPAFALDVFFTFNIAISIMVLLVAMYTLKPLDFSVFPTVLLVTTLLLCSTWRRRVVPAAIPGGCRRQRSGPPVTVGEAA